jgi:hypothetical protein
MGGHWEITGGSLVTLRAGKAFVFLLPLGKNPTWSS